MKQQHELLHTNTTETNIDKKNRLTGLHRLAAIGALSTLALTGCAADNVGAAPNPSETTQTQVEEEPTPTPAVTAEAYGGIEPNLEGEALTAAFEIPAGLSDEELAQAFIDRMNAWMMYGATPERAAEWLADRWKGSDGWLTEYGAVASNNEDAISPALFAEEAITSEGNLSLLALMQEINADSIYRYVRTSFPDLDPEDTEPYLRWRELVSVKDVSTYQTEDGTRSLQIAYVEKANGDKNTALGDNQSLSEGIEGFWNVAFVTDGSHERVQGIMDFKPSS
ncbi:hypothetical protein AB2L57_05830 [Microbacterium sp. HA-8]|uniref:hypothetical protein n=1 Tax=Microbacterium sp. HA-8 TaxID=3234200 RepID=UPI0038F75FFC